MKNLLKVKSNCRKKGCLAALPVLDLDELFNIQEISD